MNGLKLTGHGGAGDYQWAVREEDGTVLFQSRFKAAAEQFRAVKAAQRQFVAERDRSDHDVSCPLRYREYGSDTPCECPEKAEVWCETCPAEAGHAGACWAPGELTEAYGS